MKIAFKIFVLWYSLSSCFFCKKNMLTYWTNLVFQRKLLGVAIDLVGNLKKNNSVCLFTIYCLIEQYCLVTCNFVSDKHTMITLSCLVSFTSSFFFQRNKLLSACLVWFSHLFKGTYYDQLVLCCLAFSCLVTFCYIIIYFRGTHHYQLFCFI